MSDHPDTANNPIECIVDERWDDTTVVLGCAGVIDMVTAPTLERSIALALENKPTSMIVDLTDIDFLASRGMAVLVATREACSPAVRFAVVADSVTSRPMKLIGLTDVLDVYATLDEALHIVRGDAEASALP